MLCSYLCSYIHAVCLVEFLNSGRNVNVSLELPKLSLSTREQTSSRYDTRATKILSLRNNITELA